MLPRKIFFCTKINVKIVIELFCCGYQPTGSFSFLIISFRLSVMKKRLKRYDMQYPYPALFTSFGKRINDIQQYFSSICKL